MSVFDRFFETLLEGLFDDFWAKRCQNGGLWDVILVTFWGHAEKVKIELSCTRELNPEGRRGSEF